MFGLSGRCFRSTAVTKIVYFVGSSPPAAPGQAVFGDFPFPLALDFEVIDRDKLLALAEANKEQIFTKLTKLAPGRIAKIDYAELQKKPTEKVLCLLYLQGVAEALDAFAIAELLQAAEGEQEPHLKA